VHGQVVDLCVVDSTKRAIQLQTLLTTHTKKIIVNPERLTKDRISVDAEAKTTKKWPTREAPGESTKEKKIIWSGKNTSK